MIDATEADVLLSRFADRIAPKDPGDKGARAAVVLLSEFDASCKRAGIETRIPPGTNNLVVFLPSGQGVTLEPSDYNGEIRVTRGGKSVGSVDGLRFNHDRQLWEGVEEDSASEEMGYRKPRRSALAVLTA